MTEKPEKPYQPIKQPPSKNRKTISADKTAPLN